LFDLFQTRNLVVYNNFMMFLKL